jgi:hypothetical protein
LKFKVIHKLISEFDLEEKITGLKSKQADIEVGLHNLVTTWAGRKKGTGLKLK